MSKLNFWIALGENPTFTKDDHYLFYVFYSGQKNGSGNPLYPKFISVDSLEHARRELHAFVDSSVDRAIHMAVLESEISEKKAQREEFKKSSPKSDSSIDSLRIGGFVGGPLEEPRSLNKDLMDLGGGS